MPTIDILQAKVQLSELVDAASHGQEFIIEDAGIPVARLIPFKAKTIIRKPGAMRGKMRISEDFDATLSLNDLMRGIREEPHN